MTTFFTADHHFGHKNILNFCNRPFADVDEMDTMMVENWNSVVGPDDTVYYVGDFTLRDCKFAMSIFEHLNGTVYMMAGSHDRWLSQMYEMGEFEARTRHNYVYFLSPLYSLNGQIVTDTESKHDLPIVLCHYSLRSWDRSHYGSWHLFGHHHGKLEPYGMSFDIGVDCWNFFPVSLEQVREKMATLKPIVDYSKSGVK